MWTAMLLALAGAAPQPPARLELLSGEEYYRRLAAPEREFVGFLEIVLPGPETGQDQLIRLWTDRDVYLVRTEQRVGDFLLGPDLRKLAPYHDQRVRVLGKLTEERGRGEPALYAGRLEWLPTEKGDPAVIRYGLRKQREREERRLRMLSVARTFRQREIAGAIVRSIERPDRSTPRLLLGGSPLLVEATLNGGVTVARQYLRVRWFDAAIGALRDGPRSKD